VRHLTLGTI